MFPTVAVPSTRPTLHQRARAAARLLRAFVLLEDLVRDDTQPLFGGQTAAAVTGRHPHSARRPGAAPRVPHCVAVRATQTGRPHDCGRPGR